MTTVRATQVVVELLASATLPSPVRLSQLVIEVCGSAQMAAGARVSQLAVETLSATTINTDTFPVLSL